jgi:hypothetical protein
MTNRSIKQALIFSAIPALHGAGASPAFGMTRGTSDTSDMRDMRDMRDRENYHRLDLQNTPEMRFLRPPELPLEVPIGECTMQRALQFMHWLAVVT